MPESHSNVCERQGCGWSYYIRITMLKHFICIEFELCELFCLKHIQKRNNEKYHKMGKKS